MSVLIAHDLFCRKCGTGHISGGPCSYPCVCGCRHCGERLDCRGKREPALDHPAYGKQRSKDPRKEPALILAERRRLRS